tara:strand:- start:76 stop:321 length:246 start_codon:yes stop_codon:yes gene_type:complete
VTIVVSPTSRSVAPALTDTLVTVAAGSVTVMSTVPLSPLNVPVTVAVPAAIAVTVPEGDTETTLVLSDDQDGFTVVVAPLL